jgi:CheY-like chemotaxis protein
MGRILSVSYDELLLETRAEILSRRGYEVVSVHGLAECLDQCERGGFDLLILGHSIPDHDKLQFVEAFRRSCSAPVISLLGNGDAPLPAADYQVVPEPQKLLQAVGKILSVVPEVDKSLSSDTLSKSA